MTVHFCAPDYLKYELTSRVAGDLQGVLIFDLHINLLRSLFPRTVIITVSSCKPSVFRRSSSAELVFSVQILHILVKFSLKNSQLFRKLYNESPPCWNTILLCHKACSAHIEEPRKDLCKAKGGSTNREPFRTSQSGHYRSQELRAGLQRCGCSCVAGWDSSRNSGTVRQDSVAWCGERCFGGQKRWCETYSHKRNRSEQGQRHSICEDEGSWRSGCIQRMQECDNNQTEYCLWAGRWIFRCLSHFILLVAPTFIYSLMSAICNFVQFPSVHASIWRWNYKVPACICWRRSPGRGDRDKNFGQCSHGCDRRKSNRSRRSRR